MFIIIQASWNRRKEIVKNEVQKNGRWHGRYWRYARSAVQEHSKQCQRAQRTQTPCNYIIFLRFKNAFTFKTILKTKREKKLKRFKLKILYKLREQRKRSSTLLPFQFSSFHFFLNRSLSFPLTSNGSCSKYSNNWFISRLNSHDWNLTSIKYLFNI